ncbi:nitroreductase family protein [Shewanella glacialimarina]|uniref:nitroreductase family protein n=1 Tax=Shewanella glacialimarina TaxID=2590884 RepID=UPI001CF90149|nr:nitroreductase family protein [Shewanella glacialimarina]UCX03983.1 nitroreductase family protein [Shewanella glacialimarina]
MKTLLRNWLPNNVKQQIRHLFTAVDEYQLILLSFLFARFPRSATWLYSLVNRDFMREQQAVLSGRLAYRKQEGIQAVSSALLRRNIHRLEKGLCMQPRRNVFATDFILATVECFATCMNNKHIEASELKWALDVLSAYFDAVTHVENIAQANAIFIAIDKSVIAGQSDPKHSFVPYQHKSIIDTDITTASLRDLCIRRRSVRWFTDKAVADDQLNEAISIALLAPSACNRQPFRFHVCNDQQLAPDIARLAGGTAGFADNIPCVITIVGDLSAYPMSRDRHVIYIDAALAAMQLMLALETLGLSSCPINWPDIDVPEQKMADRLRLTDFERPVMLVAIGYADPHGMIPYSQKKSINVIRTDVI